MSAAVTDADLAALRGRLVGRAIQLTGRRFVGAGFPTPDDLAQTVVQKLLQSYDSADVRSWAPARLYGVAYRALHNLVIDEIRRMREVLAPSAQPPPEPAERRPGPEQAALRAERRSIMERCLETLKEAARDFLRRSFELGSAVKAQSEGGWPPGGGSNACHVRRRLIRRVQACVEEQQ